MKWLMAHSNCLWFAVLLYCRRVAWLERQKKRDPNFKGHAGYLCMRRSRLGSGPHFLYLQCRNSGHLRFIAYSPHDKRILRFPPPFFTGYTKWGDK